MSITSLLTDIELGRMAPPHAKRKASDPDALEARLEDDPATLLGWVKGLVKPEASRNGLRGAQVYPFHFGARDELGCMVGGQTMVATGVIETCHIVDCIAMEALNRSGSTLADVNPYPLYAQHRELWHSARDAIVRVVRWRYLPVTMNLFEQLFDLADFVAAGTEDVVTVTNLQWVSGDDVGKIDFLPGSVPVGGKASESGSLLKPATKAPNFNFELPKTDPKLLADLQAIVKGGTDWTRTFDPLRSVTGNLTHTEGRGFTSDYATTTMQASQAMPSDNLTADKVQDAMRRMAERMRDDKERRLMDALRPRW